MTSKNPSSIFKDTLAVQQLQDGSRRFTLEFGLFIALLFGSFLVMVNDLKYNTLFLDEAINAVIGGDFLLGNNSRNALTFHFGSYLYPALSAIMNKIGGITAMRLTSTVLICLAAVFVYLTARKLFGHKAALFSILLFSFSGNILNLGQLAVYDALALPFLAAAFYLLVLASISDKRQRRLLFASSACTVLATLSKYIGLIYIPALFMTALVLLLLRGVSLRLAAGKLFNYFLLPVALALSFYGAVFWRELVQVFQEQGFSPAPRWLILKIIGQEIGIIVFLALAGIVLLLYVIIWNRNPISQEQLFNGKMRFDWSALSRINRIILFLALSLLFLTWLAAPFQQLLTANNRSLWKNCAYSLVFLAPIAGYLLSVLIEYIRSRKLPFNVIGLVLFVAGVLYFADKSLDSNWSFHGSWPNTTGVITYLQDADLDENSRILAEGMDIYEYYLDSGRDVHPAWDNFWYMDYGGVSGQEGVLAAIHDRAFDYIIIEDYYFPGLRERVNSLLAETGYVSSWQETQTLRSGDTILLQIFTQRNDGLR